MDYAPWMVRRTEGVIYFFFHPPRLPGAPPLERGDGLSLITPPNSWPPSRIDFGL
jgi:hypothetical protein